VIVGGREAAQNAANAGGTAVAAAASMTRLSMVTVGVCLLAATLSAQTLDLTDPAIATVVARDQEATLTYENRPIVVLRARVLNRLPADRVESALQTIRGLVAQGAFDRVEARPLYGGQIIRVGPQDVLAIVPADLDVLRGELVETVAADAASRLQQALTESRELRSFRSLLRAALAAAAATFLLWALLWLLVWIGRVASRRVATVAERRETTTWRLAHAANLPRFIAFLITIAGTIAGGLFAYLWLSFVLRQFPYTRPWGESLRSLLLGQLTSAGQSISAALPGLIAVAVILLIARAVTKAVAVVFDAVAAGRMTLPGVYPDTAIAARRLVTAMLWLLAAAMAYPHVPGSESSAFKGLSVFVGVVVSLGSSGVMQHLMSGMMLTFSRAIHVGDFARIGDVVGTVIELGSLATKVRTPYGEEITIPNAVVVSQNTTNYSGRAGATVPFLTTSVTIGYDTPWRQVEGLLLTAARETGGVCAEPAPFVWREGLEDFYVKYTLLVAPADPCQRAALLDRLHVRILDAFNQYGVQIMSPHYFADPHAPKVVPPPHWHDAPAAATAATAPATVPDDTAARRL